jgi:hypothetical protein
MKFFNRRSSRKKQELKARLSNLETVVDCLLSSPRWSDSEEVGFNGQAHRKAIFGDIIKAIKFDAILETGTWIGNTTGYMRKTSGLPVYTCEINQRFHSLAKMRLQEIPDITFALGDSRSFLRKLASQGIANKLVFIYLDAHWYEDLPLKEEVDIICSIWKNFVIMVDDFQVPGDSGYGYDDYGNGKALSMSGFSDTFLEHGLVTFFPSLPSSQETGPRQGCVVLTRKGKMSELLAGLQSLRMKG